MSLSSNSLTENSSISETEIFVKGKIFSSLVDNFEFYTQIAEE